MSLRILRCSDSVDSGAEAESPSRWERVCSIYQQLELTDYERKIFKFYYFEHHMLKQWPGPETISCLSKICSRICRKIRKKLKEQGEFFI